MSLTSVERADTREAHVKAVRRVIGIMHERLDEPMSLREMAHVAYMSRFHFARTFHTVTGVRPRQYLRAVRLHAAKRLLVGTSSSVTDVCLDVGYSSLGTFIRCFTSLLGVSPRRFRVLAKQQNRDLLAAASTAAECSDERRAVSGSVIAPERFAGLVFVGLFRTAIPQGAPVTCAVVPGSGPFRMSAVPDGTYYVFALGVPWGATPEEFVLCESAPRGGGERIVVRDVQAVLEVRVTLHDPLPTDPPLLVTLPALLSNPARRMARAASLADMDQAV
jgi:AraC family transcriptional regulator